MKNALQVKGLKKTYVQKHWLKKNQYIHALKGVSFEIKKGEIFGILGPNGAGKSTILNILADLLTKDSGKVVVFGKDFFKETTKIKQEMALINGYSSYPWRLTVFENMKIYAKIYGIKNYEKRINELLKIVGLMELRDRRFSQLSSGQRTRVNIVKGLIHKPKLILMDEPTIGLDPHIAKKIREMIKEINTKEKTTIIFTSHNMNEVEEVCNRVALLKKGKILRTATIKELINLIDIKTFGFKFTGKIEKLKKILAKYKLFNIETKKNLLTFQTGKNFRLSKLIIELVKKKIQIQNISIKKPTLEQVFIEVAEGRL